MNTTKNKVGITIRIDEGLRNDFNRVAREDGFSPGNLIRNFMIKTVKESKAAN